VVANTHTQKKKQKTRYILSRTVGSDRRNSSAKDPALALCSWYFDVFCLFILMEFHSPWIFYSMQPWSLELENPKHLELLVAVTMPFEAARFGEKASGSRKELKHFHQTMP
jgi:hypothetical protein